MGLRTAILEKSKAKSSTSSVLPTSHSDHTRTLFHHSNPKRQNSSSETSSASTPRRSQAIEEPVDPDSYEAFLAKAERDERERLEVEELERRIRKRTESWEQEKRKDGGTRAWLSQNGLAR